MISGKILKRVVVALLIIPAMLIGAPATAFAATSSASSGLTHSTPHLVAAPRAVALPSLEVRAMNIALTKRGDPYVWGATGPNAFDCSGLVYYSYKRLGKYLPRIAQDQRNHTQWVSYTNRRPGDLVFFAHGSYVFHVGIYIGVFNWGGKPRSLMIAAATPSTGVKIEPIFESWDRYDNITFGRVN